MDKLIGYGKFVKKYNPYYVYGPEFYQEMTFTQPFMLKRI